MDKYIFNLINGFAGKWACLDAIAIFFAKYFDYILPFVLLAILIAGFKKNWRMVLYSLICAFVSRFIIASFVRLLWFRPRPFVENSVNLLVSHNPNEASFPSGHASFYFALSTVVYLHNKKLGIFFYIFTILMTLSRVFIGIHWPSDILAGAVIGIFVGWLGNKLIVKFLKKKEIQNI